MPDLHLVPSKTALVLIDLQKGVVAMPTRPASAQQVLERGVELARAFREAGATVVLVRVAFTDGQDALKPVTDQPPASGDRPPGWSEIVPELGPEPKDLVLTKRNWGAFHGTELDLQLRRRGIDTIVLGGIASEFGVDTTAREAYQHGYQQVFAEDAITGLSEAGHAFVTGTILPRMGRLRSSAQILQALRNQEAHAGR